MKSIGKIISFLLIALMTSCATNPPEHILNTQGKPIEELAVIHLNKSKLKIGSVDGKAVPLVLKDYPSFYIEEGKHQLRLLINYKNFPVVKDQSKWEFSQSLCIDVEAAKSYRVDAAVNTVSWRLRLFDETGELFFAKEC